MELYETMRNLLKMSRDKIMGGPLLGVHIFFPL